MRCILIAAAAGAAVAASSCSTKAGFDVGGHDVGEKVPCASIDDCCSACTQSSTCVQAVYQVNSNSNGDNACYFKSGGDPRAAAAGLSLVSPGSGTPTPPPAPTPATPLPPTPPSIPDQPATQSIWPQPSTYTFNNQPWPIGKTAQLAGSFAFTCSNCPAELTAATKRYRNIIFFAGPPASDPGSTAATISSCSVAVKDTAAPLEVGMDESYSVNVSDAGAAGIVAQTQWGAMRGLESFSQLVQWSGDGNLDADSGKNVYEIAFLPLLVTDTPRFRWRGMMFDTSRHFLTTAAILHTLDAMSYHKFNVFHWHASDDNSWALESTTYPNLTALSAYSKAETYSAADVKQIMQAARERGIVVYFEWDMPAHSRAICHADISACTPWLGSQPPQGCIIDPVGPGSYNLVTGLLSEFVKSDQGTIGGKKLAHFGGDEAGFGCWETDAKVQDFAEKNKLTNSSGGVNSTLMISHFEKTVAATAVAQGVAPVFWNDAFMQTIPDSFPADAIFETWTGPDCQYSIGAGYRCLSAWGYYLDQQKPGEQRYGWVDTWKDFYLREPAIMHDNTPMNAATLKNFLGGEGAMWGEAVDATNIDSRVWPRASAIAERLWSAPLEKYPYTTTPAGRLSRMRCHLVHRGVGAGPIGPNQGGDHHCATPPTSRFATYIGWD